MGEDVDRGSRPCPPPGQFYEVLGRVLAAVKDSSSVLQSADWVDWWEGAPGGSWHIEWQGGPFPHEVAADLLTGARNIGEGSPALRGALDDCPQLRSNGCDRAVLTVHSVPVHLRALEPVGAEEASRRALARSATPRALPAELIGA
jgi:hypothetical protein